MLSSLKLDPPDGSVVRNIASISGGMWFNVIGRLSRIPLACFLASFHDSSTQNATLAVCPCVAADTWCDCCTRRTCVEDLVQQGAHLGRDVSVELQVEQRLDLPAQKRRALHELTHTVPPYRQSVCH